MKRGVGCVRPSSEKPPRVCLGSRRGCSSLPRSTIPFGAEFQLVGFFWCMLLCTPPRCVFFSFERRELHSMTLPVVASNQAGQSSSLEGGGWFLTQASRISFLLLSSLRRETLKKRGGGCWGRCAAPKSWRWRASGQRTFSPRPQPWFSLPFPLEFGRPWICRF
jgi:hypothetical protein